MGQQEEQNKATVRRFVSAYSKGDIAEAMTLVTGNYRSEDAGVEGTTTVGSSAFEEALRSIRASLPDVTEEILDLVAEGDKVAFRIRATGHHTGTELRGIPATGAVVSWECFGIWSVDGGKLAGEVFLDDVPAIMSSLGA
jgi:predicted ester cyclase